MELKQKSRIQSAKDFRDAILFEEILRSQKDLPIYNTNGYPFYIHFSIFLGVFAIGIWVLYVVNTSKKYDEKLGRKFWF